MYTQVQREGRTHYQIDYPRRFSIWSSDDRDQLEKRYTVSFSLRSEYRSMSHDPDMIRESLWENTRTRSILYRLWWITLRNCPLRIIRHGYRPRTRGEWDSCLDPLRWTHRNHQCYRSGEWEELWCEIISIILFGLNPAKLSFVII